MTSVVDIARNKNGKLSAKSLSWYLRARVDRQVNGLKLVRGDKKYGLDTWKVEKL